MIAIKVITEALKRAFPERRPDGGNGQSFPSEHAAQSTAAAIIIQREYPGALGSIACALATGVALSRIAARKHYPRDVVAGALIGMASVWVASRMRATIARLDSISPATDAVTR
ncbi:MAG TPA: phosphatase PAP2 family protein [Sphingomicrobium sp.]|nr:phosphatase PAP2 family protein [Sphingomicrobium sp.]